MTSQFNALEKTVGDIKSSLTSIDGPLAERMAALSKLETAFHQGEEALEQKLNLMDEAAVTAERRIRDEFMAIAERFDNLEARSILRAQARTQ